MALGRIRKVIAINNNFARHFCRFGQQSGNRECSHRLARTGLACNTENLARLQPQRDVIDDHMVID